MGSGARGRQVQTGGSEGNQQIPQKKVPNKYPTNTRQIPNDHPKKYQQKKYSKFKPKELKVSNENSMKIWLNKLYSGGSSRWSGHDIRHPGIIAHFDPTVTMVPSTFWTVNWTVFPLSQVMTWSLFTEQCSGTQEVLSHPPLHWVSTKTFWTDGNTVLTFTTKLTLYVSRRSKWLGTTHPPTQVDHSQSGTHCHQVKSLQMKVKLFWQVFENPWNWN